MPQRIGQFPMVEVKRCGQMKAFYSCELCRIAGENNTNKSEIFSSRKEERVYFH